MSFEFKLLKKDKKTRARIGRIKTDHGFIDTPAFMPVGTLGTVKTASPDELKSIGADIILGNTYHLYLRPGMGVIEKMGGLHKFMSWDRPILTDSGGYQVFSLGSGRREEGKDAKSLVKIKETGVEFSSHLDGSKHLFTPEKVIDIQATLGADIMMPLDYCPSANAPREEIEKAVDLTSKWFEKAWKYFIKIKSKQALFAIVQGGTYKDLRKKSFEELSRFPVHGFSVGGVANAGESKLKQQKALEAVAVLLPENKPRYLMGVGEPIDIINAVQMGMDMFDCVLPTRLARHGAVYTRNGKLTLTNKKYILDKKPIEKNCECYACQNFSRAYISHLLREKEVLGIRLTTIHNLYFNLELMKNIREAIKEDKFLEFKKKFVSDYSKC